MPAPSHLGFGASGDVKKDYETMKGSVMEEVRRIFKPEFLNRIDETIVFHSLTREEIRSIAGLIIQELQNRCLEQTGIRLKVSPAVKAYIAEAGFDEKYGARPLRRAVQTKLEDPLAEELLSGAAKAGDTILASMKKGKLEFSIDKPE